MCRRFGVRRLDLFGSAAIGRFDPARSDLDFLVAFEEMPPGKYAKACFGLREGSKRCSGAESTLLAEGSIENPYLRRRSKRNDGLCFRRHDCEPSRRLSLGRATRGAKPAVDQL
ncbi:MAG TPA: nucleotidyltransferase domain-containing protein [Stellaceae bacterium]|nr:nucleotidyltransferase domain-containing protein [Stellaceae bacterium]